MDQVGLVSLLLAVSNQTFPDAPFGGSHPLSSRSGFQGGADIARSKAKTVLPQLHE